MARQFTRSRGRLGTKRLTSWLAIDANNPVLTPGVTALVTHSLIAAEVAKIPFTIIRTHLFVHAQSDQTGALEFQMWGIGGCVVSTQAIGIGITAVPTPMTDLDSDKWFLHGIGATDFVFISGVGIDAHAGWNYQFDSKGARRVEDGEQPIFVAETSGLTGNGVVLNIAGRMLIKEH